MIAKSNSRQQIDDYKQTVVRKGPDNRFLYNYEGTLEHGGEELVKDAASLSSFLR